MKTEQVESYPVLPYHDGHPNGRAVSMVEDIRISTFVCLNALQAKGWEIRDMKRAIDEFVEKDHYELARGAANAIEEFKRNPQLSLF